MVAGHWAQDVIGPLATGRREGLKPLPRGRVSEWAEGTRWVDPSTSPNPGLWSNARVPYLTGIMDAVCDPRVESVWVKCASQVGKTEILLNILGYIIDQDPGPVLMVCPTLDAARKHSKIRIAPMLTGTECLRSKITTGKEGRGTSRKGDQTILYKDFPGGYFVLVGANAPSGLAALPIRWVLFDEIDRFPASAGNEGDPLLLAIQRSRNFTNRKIVGVSTPTIDGKSPIQDKVEGTTEERYWVPCTECAELMVLAKDGMGGKGGLAWETDPDGTHHPETAMYICPHCGCALNDADKENMLALGEWIPDNPAAPPEARGFHGLSALYSPWVSFAAFAKTWLEASKSGDREKLREAINLLLGTEFKEGVIEVDTTKLSERVEAYSAEVPDGVRALTCGVDTQDDRLEYEVVGWGVGSESWGIQTGALWGDPEQQEVWDELDVLIGRQWLRGDGTAMAILSTAIDAMGHKTDDVYRFTKPRMKRGIFAIQGKGGPAYPLVGKPGYNNRYRAALFPVGVDLAKSTLMGRVDATMALNPETDRLTGPGVCHWPSDPERGYDAEWFAQLMAEEKRYKGSKGREVPYWHPLRKRNEALDCRVYAWAAMVILSPTLKLLSPKGKKRPAPKPKRRKRRVRSKGIQRW